MARLWAVIKREYLEAVRTKWFIFSTFFAPFLLGVLMILPIWLISKTATQSDIAHVAILDASGTGLGKRVQSALGGGVTTDTSRTQLVVLDTMQLAASESAFTHLVMKKETGGYLVLGPRVLQDSVMRYAGRNGASMADVARIEGAVRQAILETRLERAGLDPERVSRVSAARKVELQSEQIGDKGRQGSGGIVKFIFSVSLAFLLYTSIVVYGQTVMRGVLEEKQTRVAEVVVSSVSTDTLLAGKVLGVGAVGITQQMLWVLTTLALTRVRGSIMRALHITLPSFTIPTITPGALLLLVFFFVLGFLLYSAIFAAVGSMVNSDREAQQAQQPFMMLLIATAVLIQPVLFNPNTKLAVVASIVPFSAPVIMPLRLGATSVPWYELAASIGALLVTIAIVIWLASRIYRTGLLMYGKRPSLREVARWVRRSA